MSGKTISLRVRQIIDERHDVKTFLFEQLDGTRLQYRAGQFLTFLIHVNGHEVRRSYSMSSAPDVDLFPAITVKRVSNGEVSRFWLDHVQEGFICRSLPPAGKFVLDKPAGRPRDIILIGAGSGITPLFSILKQALSSETTCHVTLLYANRNESQTLFRKHIQAWEQRYPERFQVVHIYSQPSDEWTGIRGRINNTRLETLVQKSLHHEPKEAQFFICGPYELMRAVEITLHYLHFSSAQIRKENFVIDPIPPPPVVSYPHEVRVVFRDQKIDFTVPAHTTILEAALAAGIQLPYSCKGGRCATCAGIATGGLIHMSVNEVLTDRDLVEGWVLTCSAYVDSDDVVIEIK